MYVLIGSVGLVGRELMNTILREETAARHQFPTISITALQMYTYFHVILLLQHRIVISEFQHHSN
jgi:hypothetical protein